jgi:hypothetical protein
MSDDQDCLTAEEVYDHWMVSNADLKVAKATIARLNALLREVEYVWDGQSEYECLICRFAGGKQMKMTSPAGVVFYAHGHAPGCRLDIELKGKG